MEGTSLNLIIKWLKSQCNRLLGDRKVLQSVLICGSSRGFWDSNAMAWDSIPTMQRFNAVCSTRYSCSKAWAGCTASALSKPKIWKPDRVTLVTRVTPSDCMSGEQKSLQMLAKRCRTTNRGLSLLELAEVHWQTWTQVFFQQKLKSSSNVRSHTECFWAHIYVFSR